MRIHAAFVFFAWLASVAAGAVDRAPLVPASPSASSVVRIKCHFDTGLTTIVRGAIIDTGDSAATYDVVLTAAHGLPEELTEVEDRCELVGNRDRRYDIRAAWRAEPASRAIADDWAVLLTGRKVRGEYLRFAVAELADDSSRNIDLVETPVRLPLLTAVEERACGLEHTGLTELEHAAGLFVHTCRSWQGHSGSPILARIDDRIVIVGVHLASRWFFEERRMLKIGRYVDTTISEAIRDAARYGRKGSE